MRRLTPSMHRKGITNKVHESVAENRRKLAIMTSVSQPRAKGSNPRAHQARHKVRKGFKHS